MSHKVSPLKKKPLNYAGESCDEGIYKIIHEKVIPQFIGISFITLMCLGSWFYYFFTPPKLLIALSYTLIAIGFWIFFIISLKKQKKIINNYKLGRDGERIVGQHIERVRGRNARIFHDIQKDDLNNQSNIDHIIVSVRGIFILETKTFSKNTKLKQNKITFNGSNILVNGYQSDKNYVHQIKSSVNWLNKKLEAMTGNKYPIKGVLIFPEWYVETTSEGRKSDIWALNLSGLDKYLPNETKKLSYEELNLVANMLETYLSNK